VSRSSRAAFMASSRWASSNGRFVGSARHPAAEVRATYRRLGQRVGALGLSRGLQRPPNGAPRRRTGGKVLGSGSGSGGGSGSGFPSSTCVLCSVMALSSLMRVRGRRYIPCGLAFRARRARPAITGPEQLVSPWVVLARSGQGPGPIRPTISAYRSLATSCTKPRPQT